MSRHHETHRAGRSGWLRAAVLGANDGIVSTASLMLGFASSGANSRSILLAGAAGMVAGALSMAAGEFVSVSSQADTEQADLDLERGELAHSPEGELHELTSIYVKRGLDPALARQVAEQLSAHDALAAHSRDELGIVQEFRARPLQAASASAAAFCVGALVPLLTALVTPGTLAGMIALVALLCLATLGASSARIGGAPMLIGAWRVTFWSALAMAATTLVGVLFAA